MKKLIIVLIALFPAITFSSYHKDFGDVLESLAHLAMHTSNNQLEPIAPIAKIMELAENPGNDVNVAITDKGDTALHLAAQFGFPSIVKDLIALGADVTKTNKAGENPLLVAQGKEIRALLTTPPLIIKYKEYFAKRFPHTR